ncbi:lipoxygenase homology domain-containing protein 1-like [Megaptera novaeangliae]
MEGVSVTGDAGTRAGVTLWVYGDPGVAGPTPLGKDSPEQLLFPDRKIRFRWLPFMSQGIIHLEIELYLQEMQISHQAKIQEEANEGDWKVTVVTGDLENAGTAATVSLYVYGETRCSGPIILGSGKHQLFNPNHADIFKINLKDNGDMYKTHIGHDNSRKDPRWYLEEIKLENIKLFCLPVDSWIAENENGAIHGRKCPL